MNLSSVELKNYKSHKSYVANFNGNALISGSKGTGKTSLKDAFTWLMTTKLVDEPRPVDESGIQINDIPIEVSCEFEDGTRLGIVDRQRFNKDGEVVGNHKSEYFFNGVPMTEGEYLSALEDKFGTLEQRRILLDPSWFAHGDGLKVAGKTSKTATQRRREIVISVAGAENLEKDIENNENKAKAAKYAISQLKKDLDGAHAGVESLHNAKVDVGKLDKNALEQQLVLKDNEKTNTIKNLEELQSGNDTHNALKRALSDAQTALSEARSVYSQDYQQHLEQAQKPHNEYLSKRNELVQKIQQRNFENDRLKETFDDLVRQIDKLELRRENLLKQYSQEQATQYVPNSTMCPTCSQPLPVDNLKVAEARFNQHKSEELERIANEGKEIATQLTNKKQELKNLPRLQDISVLSAKLHALKEPVVEEIIEFEKTVEYRKLMANIATQQKALEELSDDGAKEIYQRAIEKIDNDISDIREQLEGFKTNTHLEKEIDKKGEELQGISERLDNQQAILDSCNDFTRRTLNDLEKTLEEKFEGIRFKMFEYTLDGTQKDTCITYAKTDNGYIPWESLSGGQKRSAIISLANAFSKAWNISLPLWIDDSQIYSEDELQADMQLIRITEVPHQDLVVK